ncbi:polycystic kidney disease protein 1-like 2 [Xenopus laevis]|uniref:Polycystic kidney disease protein 1-like 2 n=1 Tax=Xenopus laevis TaxID=8355 RepID=A0A8J1MW69_XENLA|nr:polycystic kidney disease protein 1-like 2 [Xenopus laevis]
MPLFNLDTEIQEFVKRRKRSIDFENSVMNSTAMFYSNYTNNGGLNLTYMLNRIIMMMNDDEERNTTELETELILMENFTGRILCEDVRSSNDFSTLQKVAYFGIQCVFQSILSPCSSINWNSIKRQSMINSALSIIQRLQRSMVTAEGEKSVVETPVFSMLITSVSSSELDQKLLSFSNNTQSTNVAVILPSLASLQPSLKGLTSLQVQMISFALNPFISDSTSVSGTVASLSFMNESQELHIENLNDNFQIFLPRSPAEMKPPMYVQMPGDKALQMSVMVSQPGSSLIIIISVNHSIELQLYHGTLHVPVAYTSNDTGKDSYTWILHQEDFSDTASLQNFLISPINSYLNQTLDLGIISFTSQCVFHDPATNQWESHGCKVGPQTTVANVQCLCNHLSFFGSSFLVLPVQVDVTRTAEYFSKISENPVIVVLLACFYGCYIIAVIWARRRDLQDQSQLAVLIDKDPCALYYYRVIICTGHWRGAATSAKVSLSLCGSDGQYGPILLSGGRRQLFKNGSIDIFFLATPFPLGELQNITLSHDGTGPKKSWFVTRVTAQDVQLKKNWHFTCNAWLSEPPRGDSLTKTFWAANELELRSFRNIFVKKTLKDLHEEHIWISAFNPPPRSSFTRVQRVSCCMGLLLCTIVINLMFWELPQASYPVIISMGSFNLTWKDIMIGFESALLMFPVNLLIIYIFRNTQPRDIKKERIKSKNSSNKHHCTISKTPAMPPSLTSVLEDLEKIVQILKRDSEENGQEQEMPLDSTCKISFLLQLITEMLHKQPPPSNLEETIPLTHLSSESLRFLFCAHYVSRKLMKVSCDLQRTGGQDFEDKQHYDESLKRLQILLDVLKKCVPPLPTQRSPSKKPKIHKRLPWWFLFIGWSLLFSISAVSTYFTMMYGFQYGRQSSIRWIVSMVLSLFQSIFILQPLKVIGFALFFTLVLKKVEVDEELEGEMIASDLYHKYDEAVI